MSGYWRCYLCTYEVGWNPRRNVLSIIDKRGWRMTRKLDRTATTCSSMVGRWLKLLVLYTYFCASSFNVFSCWSNPTNFLQESYAHFSVFYSSFFLVDGKYYLNSQVLLHIFISSHKNVLLILSLRLMKISYSILPRYEVKVKVREYKIRVHVIELFFSVYPPPIHYIGYSFRLFSCRERIREKNK